MPECKKILLTSHLLLSGLLLLVSGPAALAQTDWPHCAPPPSAPALSSQTKETAVTADHVAVSEGNIYTFSGNVIMEDAQQHLQTDQATYNKGTGELSATGQIHYQLGQLDLRSHSAALNIEQLRGYLEQVNFHLFDRHARGSATRAELQSAEQTTLHRVNYTTCDEGNNDWHLSASRVQLDQASGFGSAYHVVLNFKQVPFFYLPYISFPINDQRKSGFLVPRLSHSDSSGTELVTPYYLNIAPATDATLTPRFMSERGTLLQGNLRYLRPHSRGSANIEILPDDRLYGDDRGLFNYFQTGTYTPKLRSMIDLSLVSDDDYFAQLGNSLSIASITHLRQQASLDYRDKAWSGQAMVEAYQTVDDSILATNRPYRRLPQLSLAYNPTPKDNRVNFALSADYTYFDQRHRLSGERLDLAPRLYYPWHHPGGWITPAITWHETRYRLENQAALLSRRLPAYSLDSGLIFEKDFVLANNQFTHTIEPQLFYLYTPYREQSQLPVFDSGRPDFTFNRLFAANRYNGKDRIGDSEQISLALTTRLLKANTGLPVVSVGLGQIFYLDERRVTLPGESIATKNQSALLGHFRADIDDLTLSSDVRYDQQQIDMAQWQIRFQPDNRHSLRLAQRYRRNLVKQSDLGASWPVAVHWHMVGRWSYSHYYQQSQETVAGLEYQSCCWTVRLAGRRYLDEAGGQYLNSAFLQLELKGLGSIGDSIENLLQDDILSYY